MPEDVEIAVIRPYLEEHVIRTIPLVQNLFHEEVTVLKPKPNGPFVRFPARVALHLDRHPVLPVQKSNIFAVHTSGSRLVTRCDAWFGGRSRKVERIYPIMRTA